MLAEIESSPILLWNRVHNVIDSLTDCSRENRDQMHNLISAIHRKVDTQLDQARQLLRERADHYDIAVAKLQLLEAQSFAVSESESEEEDMEISLTKILMGGYSDAESEPESERIIQMDESDLAITKGVAIDCWVNHNDAECQTDRWSPDEELVKANHKYLVLGMAWKKKYQEMERKHHKMTKEGGKEAQKICEMIPQIRSSRK